jgi:polysaccharide export outer membrane protein
MTSYRLKACVQFVLLLFVAPACVTSVGAQAQGSRLGNNQTHAPVSVPVSIASGDLLDVTVYDAPELTQEIRVESDGNVRLALIGPTKVAGMTAQQAGESIARELTAHNFLLSPQVNVLIKEFATQGVSVTGEVQHPGVYPALGSRTLLDVVSMAGGLTSIADTRITIKHRSGAEESLSVKLTNDNAQTSLDNNVQVYPGDLIVVPRAGIVYVLGDVGRAGGFVMQDNGKITLLQALAQAGGANRTAAINQAFLLRKNASGYATDKIRVGDLVRGRGGDVDLNANDIVFFPSSRLKYFVQDTQGVVASVAGAAVYHIVP